MAFISMEEAHPKQEGVYRVMVESIDEPAYESKAEWTEEDGFQLIKGKMKNEGYIVSWWTNDNVR